MIRIDKCSLIGLENVLEKHCKSLIPIIKRRIEKLEINEDNQTLIKENLYEILSARPEDLLEVNDNYSNLFDEAGITAENIQDVFSYQAFTKKQKKQYDIYQLAENLNVNVCPYCNRNYTFTVINRSKLTRPDFDHFYPKSEYALLSLSFFNLIPSCKTCNSTFKGKISFNHEEYLNPYSFHFGTDALFSYIPSDFNSSVGYSENLKVKILKNSASLNHVRITKNIETFKLEELYEKHSDIASEVLQRFLISNGKHLENLMKLYPELTSEDLYQIAFGNYFKPSMFHKRPLSKLTRDIFDELKWIIFK